MQALSHPINEDYVQRNFRWNFAFNLAETSLTLFGRGFISPQVFLPVLLSLFTDSKVLIGLVGILIPVGFMLPQLLVAPYVESLKRKKPLVVRLAVIERFLYLVLAGLVFLAPRLEPALLVGLILLVVFLAGLSGGVTQIGWGELMAAILPPGSRGLYFGTASFVGGLLGALGGVLAGIVLSTHDFPLNYALAFLIGAVLSLVGWAFLFGIREPHPVPLTAGRRKQASIIKDLLGLLNADPRFKVFLSVQSIAVLGGLAYPFIAVYGRDRFDLTGAQIGLLSACLLLGNTLASPTFGLLGDRLGHHKALTAAVGLQTLGYALAACAASPMLLYMALFLLGGSRAAGFVSVQPAVYAYAPLSRRPTYIGLSSTLFGFFTVFATLLGGSVAQSFSYVLLLALSAAISAAAFLAYLWFIQPPLPEASIPPSRIPPKKWRHRKDKVP